MSAAAAGGGEVDGTWWWVRCGHGCIACARGEFVPSVPTSSLTSCHLASLPLGRSALREQVLAQVEGAAPVSGEDGVYRGMNAYKDYRAGFRREHTIGGWVGGWVGEWVAAVWRLQRRGA